MGTTGSLRWSWNRLSSSRSRVYKHQVTDGFWCLNSRWSAGTSKERLLTEKMICILNFAGNEDNYEIVFVTVLVQGEKMGWRSPSSSLECWSRRSRKITFLKNGKSKVEFVVLGGFERADRVDGRDFRQINNGDSQSSRAQWNKDSKTKERNWNEITKAFHETGLPTRDRKASWDKSCERRMDCTTASRHGRKCDRKSCDSGVLRFFFLTDI